MQIISKDYRNDPVKVWSCLLLVLPLLCRLTPLKLWVADIVEASKPLIKLHLIKQTGLSLIIKVLNLFVHERSNSRTSLIGFVDLLDVFACMRTVAYIDALLNRNLSRSCLA